jgi:hypothetical protein
MSTTTNLKTSVRDTVETLIEKQSARLAGAPFGDRCITVTGTVNRRYRSLGGRRGKSFKTFIFDTILPQPNPTAMDFGIWPVLERLAEETGDSSYGELLNAMIQAFADYGFDPRSGLGYFGAMTHFDVVRLGPSPYMGAGSPGFKFTAGLPYEKLWEKMPEQMDRMFKAFFWGMITRPETMDYNRYGFYGFDDSRREHTMPYQPGHIAFAGAGAWMIEAWAFHYSKTGDAESLARAQAMADKWLALQSPETGLVPHFLGSKKEGETSMTAQTYCNIGDANAAIAYLDAARTLEGRSKSVALANQLKEMGRMLITGLAKYCYDAQHDVFQEWLHVEDGSVHTEAYTYHFHSQEQKDHWTAIDPTLAEVAVHSGNQYYQSGPAYWSCGVGIPLCAAKAAERTNDSYLLERARFFADGIMQSAPEESGPCNEAGQWIFPASGSYLHTMLHLYRITDDEEFLKNARLLASAELERLASPAPEGIPEWWRFPFRSGFLFSLLELHAAESQG